jgi:hypothetical protein
MMVRLAEAALYTSPAPPGTKACDAEGGAFRPEWKEGSVRTRCPRAILCASDALLRVARNQELGLPTFLSCIAAGNRSIALRR